MYSAANNTSSETPRVPVSGTAVNAVTVIISVTTIMANLYVETLRGCFAETSEAKLHRAV